MYIYIYIHTYIHTYICREREIRIHIYIYDPPHAEGELPRPPELLGHGLGSRRAGATPGLHNKIPA